jgi:hypothetical protein
MLGRRDHWGVSLADTAPVTVAGPLRPSVGQAWLTSAASYNIKIAEVKHLANI